MCVKMKYLIVVALLTLLIQVLYEPHYRKYLLLIAMHIGLISMQYSASKMEKNILVADTVGTVAAFITITTILVVRMIQRNVRSR